MRYSCAAPAVHVPLAPEDSRPTTPRRNPSDPLGPGNYYGLAQATGLAKQHISRVLRGRAGVSLAAAHKIASAAGVTVDEVYEHIRGQREAAARNGNGRVRKGAS